MASVLVLPDMLKLLFDASKCLSALVSLVDSMFLCCDCFTEPLLLVSASLKSDWELVGVTVTDEAGVP